MKKKIYVAIVAIVMAIMMTIPTFAATTSKQTVIDSVVKIYNDSADKDVSVKAFYNAKNDVICVYYYGNTANAVTYALTKYSSTSSLYKKALTAMNSTADSAVTARKVLTQSGNYSTDVWVLYSNSYTATESSLLSNSWICFSAKYEKWVDVN